MKNTQEQLDNYFNTVDKCKASGKVIKILKTEGSCSNYYRFKLNNGIKDYVIRGFEKNINATGSGCLDKNYTFSGGEIPKIGDQIYMVGIYSEAFILKTGKDIYNNYLNLPDCQIYSDLIGGDEYLWADKCKVTGKIEQISRSFKDICGLNLGIKVKNGENTYILGGREYFTGEGISLCLGTGEGSQSIDITDGKITTNFNIGDDFYAVLNQKDNTILRYGQDEYNADNSIPVCNPATDEQIKTFTGGITENQLKLIMNTVEKQILNDFPDLKYKQEKTIESSGTIIDSTGKIKNQDKGISRKTSYIPKKLTTSTINELKETKPVLENQTKENISDFSGTIEQLQTETGNIQKDTKETKTETELIELKKQEETGNISYSIIGIILIIFIVFVYIFRKNKKQD